MTEMRSPDGKVYDVPEDQVATLARDQGFVPNDAPAAPTGAPTILKSKDGRMYEAATPEEAAVMQRDQGMSIADDEEVATRTHERELYGKYGGAGQQALGLAEAFYRNASLGVLKGMGGEQEIRERAQVTSDDSPVLYGAASVAPAIAAGVATGGAGLGVAGTIAAEGVLGGLGNLSSEQDAAFLADQELSAEAAWGAFGKGAILGAGTTGALMGAGKLLSRNRFAEASRKIERRAEKAAFSGVGIDTPMPGLVDAVGDPVKAAKIRAKGRNGAEAARTEFGESLQGLDDAERAATGWEPPAGAVDADGATARAAVRKPLDALRSDLEPIASEADRAVVARAFDAIDRAGTPDELYQAVRASRANMQGALASTADAAAAKALKRGVDRLTEIEGSQHLWGAPAQANAARTQAIGDLNEARTALNERLGGGNYLEMVGMRSAKPVDEALDTYVDRLGAVVRESKGMPGYAEANAALARMRRVRESGLRDVAALNQVDAVSALKPGDVRPEHPGMGELLGDLAKEGASIGAAGPYAAFKASKLAVKGVRYMMAAPENRGKIVLEIGKEVVDNLDPLVKPARMAYKYRHYIQVLAEGLKDEAVDAAQNMVSAVKREGAAPMAERYAKSVITPAQFDATRKAVETLIKDPSKLAEHIAGEIGDMANASPELVMALNQRGAAAVQFLSSKMPPSFGFNLLYPDGPPPSRADVVEMDLYMRGVSDPEGVMRAIGDGTAMPEEVEAFRAVHPNSFAELQRATHVEVQLANERGEVIPARRIMQLETLLDMPGQLDPTFGDQVAYVARGQLLAQKEAQKSPSYTPAPKAGARVQPTGAKTA